MTPQAANSSKPLRPGRGGVRVRVVYDWMGTKRYPWSRFWMPLTQAGGEIRCFNPPRLDSPLGWLSRDHRKMIAADGQVGYVTGLCLSDKWQGDPDRGIDPCGIQVSKSKGLQCVTSNGPSPRSGQPQDQNCQKMNFPTVTVFQLRGNGPSRDCNRTNTTGLYRLDQLIAALAKRTLWLTDAYFVGIALMSSLFAPRP